MSAPPRLPLPPGDYSVAYFNQLLRALDVFFTQLTTPGPFYCTEISAVRIDPITGARTLGLVPSANLTATASPADTSITVDSAAQFPAKGTALLCKAGAFDRITYTGKTATTLTGIPASGIGSIANTYHHSDVVAASAVTGRVYCNKAAEYSLHIVP
jgi:hypothetical protein